LAVFLAWSHLPLPDPLPVKFMLKGKGLCGRDHDEAC